VTVQVLLCQDLAHHGLSPQALARFAEEEGAQAVVVPGLCLHPDRIRRAAAGAEALVIATCHQWQAEGAIERHARAAGISPLALQVVPLARICQGDADPMGKAQAALAGALARARAFPGARPENLRPALPSRGPRVSRRALLSLPSLVYRPVPTLHKGLCAAERGCRHCVSQCPHGALYEDGGIIHLRREACTSCGLCVTACPHQALQMPGWGPPEVAAQMAALLERGGGRGLAFICPQSPPPGGPWLAVNVPCAAAVPLAAMLTPLSRGAPAVAIVHCGALCRSGRRSQVEEKLGFAQALLEALGLGKGRIFLAETSEKGTLLPSPAGPAAATTSRPGLPHPSLAGAGADAAAVMELSHSQDVYLLHTGSPLGMVQIDPEACTICGTCAGACPTSAIRYTEEEARVSLTFDPRVCIACGQCLEVCPERERGAIVLRRGVDTTFLRQGPETVAQDRLVLCRRCQGPVASQKMVQRVIAMLGPQVSTQRLAELCSQCRGLPF
jgi:ferredoxin